MQESRPHCCVLSLISLLQRHAIVLPLSVDVPCCTHRTWRASTGLLLCPNRCNSPSNYWLASMTLLFCLRGCSAPWQQMASIHSWTITRVFVTLSSWASIHNSHAVQTTASPAPTPGPMYSKHAWSRVQHVQIECRRGALECPPQAEVAGENSIHGACMRTCCEPATCRGLQGCTEPLEMCCAAVGCRRCLLWTCRSIDVLTNVAGRAQRRPKARSRG